MVTMKVDSDKIRDVIGKGSNHQINYWESGASIDIDDDGTINIFGEGLESRDKAVSLIEGITAEAEVGQIYTGKVNKIADFGAFVNILPGKDGLVTSLKSPRSALRKSLIISPKVRKFASSFLM